jgi:D-alanyl-D-alanine carboxypeptidase/D-alanyl-D-alanine-endopeptidase (penicillin-binding protein 4)
MSRPRLPVVARAAALLVVAAAAVAGGYAVTAAVHHRPTAAHPPPPAAYRSATSAPPAGAPPSAAPLPAASTVGSALRRLVGAPALGQLHAEVLDVATGRVLYARAASTGEPPASTAKLLTAAAVLTVHRVTDRIRTRVVAGPSGAVVLVGGGDPTLSGAKRGAQPAYPDAARISDLAAQLRRGHVSPSRIVVDDSLFSGPAVNPAWAPEDVPSLYASAITAVLADGGRSVPGAAERSTTPDLAAGHELAAALGRPALPVVHGRAAAGARTLAAVWSAPYGTLVEQMLQQSDNVIAECLARQVALAERQPVSFTGAAHAVAAVLRRLGTDPGTGMLDGSGLAAGDRLSAATLAGIVRLVATRPPLRAVIAGLPVAAWSGTLAGRYLSGAARAGAGVVRAKTGTLTGVSTLAGTVHDHSGRLLAFAFLADHAAAPEAAEPALDALAAALAGL